jgi:hydrogenase expression/formation protein HypE
MHGLVAAMVAVAGRSLRLPRDPTRGGLASTLNEMVRQSRLGFLIESLKAQDRVPVRPKVLAAC